MKVEMENIFTCPDDLEQYSWGNCLNYKGKEKQQDWIVNDEVLNTRMEACIPIEDTEGLTD